MRQTKTYIVNLPTVAEKHEYLKTSTKLRDFPKRNAKFLDSNKYKFLLKISTDIPSSLSAVCIKNISNQGIASGERGEIGQCGGINNPTHYVR